jgi:hypothetical protein
VEKITQTADYTDKYRGVLPVKPVAERAVFPTGEL